MRLRRNLIISQVVAVAILLCILIFSILVFFRTTLPLIETGLETKARSCAETLAALVDVGIAADDRVTLLNALRRCSHPGSMPDPDLKSVAIVDTNGNILASLGKVPKGLPDPPTAVVTVAQRLPGVYRAVAQVAIEGTVLGGVWAEYHTNRVKDARNSFVFSHSVGLVAILIACILSILFAFHLVKPLRKMISFVHVVAKGNLTARLSVKASDELGVLADDLNHMADELQHRHTVEEAVFKASRMFLDPGETSRDEALAVLGQAVSSDWAYLFKQTDDEKLNVVNLWCHPGTEHRLRENLPAVTFTFCR